MTRTTGSGRLSEVAAAGCAVEGQRLDALGHDVDHAIVLLQPSADEEGGAAPGHPAVAHPAPLRADDVDEPVLVLEVDEDRALGGGRTLAVGHDPADQHLLAVVDVA